jgi:hypothetical protein
VVNPTVIGDLDIRDGLHLVTETLGHVPRVREFRSTRKELQAEAKFRGELLLIPSYQSIQRRYPTWDKALIANDLPPLGGSRTRDRTRVGGRPVSATTELCITAINQAREDLGDPLTASAYKRWRLDEIRRDPTRTYALPSLSAILRRLSGWQVAILAAVAAAHEC